MQLFANTGLQEIGERSFRYRLSFIAGSCFLLMSLIWWCDGRIQLETLSVLKTEHSHLRSNYPGQYRKLQNLIAQQTNYAALNKQFSHWQQTLLTGQQISTAFEWLNQTAYRCNLKVLTLKPLQPQDKAFWSEIFLVGAWQGDYHGAACLAQNMANSPYKIAITNFTISNADGNDAGVATETLVITSKLKLYVRLQN